MAKRAPVRSATKSNLAKALAHVELCASGAAHFAPFCIFQPGWLVGYDGIVGAGFRVTEELHGVCPETTQFKHAIERAGEPFSITLMPDNSIRVSGGKIRATINTISPEAMHNVQPDRPCFAITEGVRNAMAETVKVTSNRNDRVIGSSVLLKHGSAVATDGGTILEAHHGNNIAGQFLVPREFVEAFVKVKYEPTQLGWSDETLTVWFGPHCWLRTNLYKEAYPDTDVMFAKMLSQGMEMRPVPQELLLALETLKPFLMPDKTVMLAPQGVFVCDADCKTFGASFHLTHYMLVDKPRAIPWFGIRCAATHGQWIGFNPDGFYWYGQVLRGITAAAA